MVRNRIFDIIDAGNLAEVQHCVRDDPAVLGALELGEEGRTPLVYAIKSTRQPEIAVWLAEQHRDQNIPLNGEALTWACFHGARGVVEVLMAAGVDAGTPGPGGWTALMFAFKNVQSNREAIVALLLKQPRVKATINPPGYGYTALSLASARGSQRLVELLLGAGADPTIPAGTASPLSHARNWSHQASVTLLECAIADPHKASALNKARAIISARLAIRKVQKEADDQGLCSLATKQALLAAVPKYLKGRVEEGQELPVVAVPPMDFGGEEEEKLRATVGYAVGLEGGAENGSASQGMVQDMYEELLGYWLPKWVWDRRPETFAPATAVVARSSSSPSSSSYPPPAVVAAAYARAWKRAGGR